MVAYRTVLLENLMGNAVLELGSSFGYGIQLLGPHARTYTAVDKKTPRFGQGCNVSFEKADLDGLRRFPDNSFDTVICFQVIEHVEEDQRLLSEIKRLLKPGGSLLLTTPNRATSLTRNPFHVREYKPGQIKALLATQFSDFDVRGIYGNSLVMWYYNENKKNVERFKRFDIFNFQRNLPPALLKWPYYMCNHLNRLILWKKIKSVSSQITWSDFYLSRLEDHCLDYFVVARKS